jgi:nicotinate dehydrogenase subunit B
MHRHGRVQRGRGVAFARYKNLTAYCAIVMEVSETRGEVKIHKVVSSVDTGTVTTAFTAIWLW